MTILTHQADGAEEVAKLLANRETPIPSDLTMTIRTVDEEAGASQVGPDTL